MSKLRTALSLLAAGDFNLLRRQLRLHLRRRVLHRHAHPFLYRLHGFPFACDPASPDSTELFLTGESDPFELGILRTWLRPGDAFIDIGANLGVYLAAAAHAVGPAGACLGIEASPATAARLRATLSLLGHLHASVEPVAVGDHPGEVTFHQALPGTCSGEQSLRPDPARLAGYHTVVVRQETLSALVTRHPAVSHPAFVKIDIEGAEPAALSAAPPSWFTSAGPLWLVELNPAALARFGSSCASLASLFPTSVFECWLCPQYPLLSGTRLPPRPLLTDETFSDALYYNLVAIPRSHPRTPEVLTLFV